MGAIVSELLAEALTRGRGSHSPPTFRWTARDMKPLLDPSDTEAVCVTLDVDRR